MDAIGMPSVIKVLKEDLPARQFKWLVDSLCYPRRHQNSTLPIIWVKVLQQSHQRGPSAVEGEAA